MTAAAIRVLVVDNDPIVRGALTTYLTTAPDILVVGTCTDGAQVTGSVEASSPDVVLMDIRMPHVDGISATRTLRARGGPLPRVLLLTAFELESDVAAGFAAGADGFLLKSESPEVIVNAVRTLHGGASVVPRQSVSSSPKPADRKETVTLTDRESEVLALLCQAHSNAEIGATLFLSESTVKFHVSAVMAKLGVRSRLKAVVRAHELGLARPPSP